MTRYARAKGSKASNERKPEEATSWSEMKRSMLSKKQEKVESQSFECPAKLENEQQCRKWAPLGGDSDSQSLLRQHLINENKKDNEMEIMEKNKKPKKKKKAVDVTEEEAEALVNGQSKKETKKQKLSSCEGSEGKMSKSKKKRKKTVDGLEGVSPKKKKKMEAIGAETSNKKEDKVVDENSPKEKSGTNLKISKKKNQAQENYKKNEKKIGNFTGKSKFRNKSFDKTPPAVEELIINGEKIEIVKFQGFYVTLEDAERLKKLRTQMKKEGIPRDKLEAAIKLERRRAEKALSRLKKNVCFHCRGRGHLLSNCPDLVEKETTGTGICYKCGSTEHSAAECKVVRGSSYQFAECFICKEQGHIARQCPDNPRGLYPQGGACRECGDVTHLRKDCPTLLAKKEEEAVTVGLRNDRNLECLDEEIVSREKIRKAVKRNSTVKF